MTLFISGLSIRPLDGSAWIEDGTIDDPPLRDLVLVDLEAVHTVFGQWSVCCPSWFIS